MFSKLEVSFATFFFTALLIAWFVNKMCETQGTPIWPGLAYVIGSGVVVGLLTGTGMFLALWRAETYDRLRKEKEAV